MKYRVHYRITGTFDVEVPDEEAGDMPAVYGHGKAALADPAFQAAMVYQGDGKRVALTGVEPVRNADGA